MPRFRSLARDIATARAFLQAAVTRQADFEQFGLPSTFISDFKTLVDRLQQAADVRLNGKTARRKAQAGISVTLAEGMDSARDLDVIVAIATRLADPATFSAWTATRQIEGQGARPAKVPAVAARSVPRPIPTPAPEVTALEKAS